MRTSSLQFPTQVSLYSTIATYIIILIQFEQSESEPADRPK